MNESNNVLKNSKPLLIGRTEQRQVPTMGAGVQLFTYGRL